MLRIGIECENLEDPISRWGVGQVTLNLLKEYADDPELQKKFQLYLYFKKIVPSDELFKIHSSKFKIRVLGFPSFNIFYHILMPARAMLDGLDYMFFPAYMLPPLYLGKSVVLLTGDVYHEYKYGDLPLKYKLAYRLFTNWAAIKAKKILAISETSKKEVAKVYNINPDRIFVSYLGVNQQPTNDRKFSEIAAQKLLVGSYLLYVGQMFPRRHAKETILAFKKISGEFPELKLIMVGKDKYPPSGRAGNPSVIKELIANTNKDIGQKIIHHDYIEKREDVDALFAGARALVYVSDREAFGLPPVEALSFGTSPVIMDNELGHELFREYAFFAKSGSIDDVADAMRRAVSDKGQTENIRLNGPEHAKKYNWKNFTEFFFKNL